MTSGPAKYSIAAGKGCFVTMRTLCVSSRSALSIQLTLAWVVDLLSGFETKFSVKTTSSAVNSLPSWNLTPRRRSNSSVLSSTCRQPDASCPLYSPLVGSR